MWGGKGEKDICSWKVPMGGEEGGLWETRMSGLEQEGRGDSSTRGNQQDNHEGKTLLGEKSGVQRCGKRGK